MPLSRETVDHPDHVFFLSSTDPNFSTGQQLYWFSDSMRVALSHADYWTNADGEKKRLLLECLIPHDSLVVDVYNYHSVRAEDIVVLRKIWLR